MKFKRITILFLIIVLQTALAIFLGGSILTGQTDDKILPGITSAGIELGGMSLKGAEEALRKKFSDTDKKSLVLKAEGRQWIIPLKDIGAYYDYGEAVRAAYAVGRSGPVWRRISELLGNKSVSPSVPLMLKFDREALLKELGRINGEYTKKPRNARLVRENRMIRTISSIDGLEMDTDKTLNKISGLSAGMEPVISIVTKILLPQVRDQDISGLTDILGECTTLFETGSEDRARNIDRAAVQLDGALVKPGEVFSFNKCISPVDEIHGYRKAPVIVGDQLVDDYGGGICQVSTTLYGAVLLSGLEITERYPHSKPVKYVPLGLDATVTEGLMDFKFKNSLSRPVYIISSSEPGGGSVNITIAGKKESNTIYKVDTDVKTITPGIIIKSNPRLKRGQSQVIAGGLPGFDVLVYRVSVFQDREGVKELISHDYYPPEPRVVEVGFLKE
ncbi:MAG: VanW family protein [Firmicutes bacterium]|nr:VanW family protein [Bacillota bacterium]